MAGVIPAPDRSLYPVLDREDVQSRFVVGNGDEAARERMIAHDR
jgi:hypothetical protein